MSYCILVRQSLESKDVYNMLLALIDELQDKIQSIFFMDKAVLVCKEEKGRVNDLKNNEQDIHLINSIQNKDYARENNPRESNQTENSQRENEQINTEKAFANNVILKLKEATQSFNITLNVCGRALDENGVDRDSIKEPFVIAGYTTLAVEMGKVDKVIEF